MTYKPKDCPIRHENGNCLVVGGFCPAVNVYMCEVVRNAYDSGRLSALREQEAKVVDFDQVKPLTLDELREMDGEPVWLMGDDKFYIVNNDFRLPWGKREPCGVDMWGAGTSLLLLAKCGLYRHKPKEV